MSTFEQRIQLCWQPPFRWTGGKSRQAEHLSRLIPTEFTHYVEPFLGSGAMFFRLMLNGCLDGKTIHLADECAELINAHVQIRDNSVLLLEKLTSIVFHESDFYSIRKHNPAKLSEFERAVRFLYIMNACHSGIYRANSAGKINTPFAKDKEGKQFSSKAIGRFFSAAKALSMATTIECADFRESISKVPDNTFVYLDPPYLSSCHPSYPGASYNTSDEQELAALLRNCSAKNFRFMMSNEDNDRVRNIFAGFKFTTLPVKRCFNQKAASSKRNVNEVVITNY